MMTMVIMSSGRVKPRWPHLASLPREDFSLTVVLSAVERAGFSPKASLAYFCGKVVHAQLNGQRRFKSSGARAERMARRFEVPMLVFIPALVIR